MTTDSNSTDSETTDKFRKVPAGYRVVCLDGDWQARLPAKTQPAAGVLVASLVLAAGSLDKCIRACIDDDAQFSVGYDAGNYASAYVTGEYSVPDAYAHSEAYLRGHLLGFFSSYELSEVPLSRRGDVKRSRYYSDYSG